ncbi:hypothetical protein C8R43DRAFT_1020507 [Mycena crocata]|nr:hypothetical protein C8R43DRAFT_1020507 [Mycena crocata]
MRRRLKRIRRSTPRLSKEMYSDLIELSRPELYPQRILDEAADILSQQLDAGNLVTAEIALTVSHLPSSEARMVILQLYRSRLRKKRTPLVRKGEESRRDFIAMLVQARPDFASTCFEVIDLDPHMPLCTDIPLLRMHAEDRSNLPKVFRAPLSELQVTFTDDRMYRWKCWELLESADSGYSGKNRMTRLESTLLDAVSKNCYETPEFYDAAVDLFDLIRHTDVPEVRYDAVDLLTRCISMDRDSWQHLRIILDLGRQERYARPGLTFLLSYGPPYTADLSADTPATSDLYLGPDLFHAHLCKFLWCAYLTELHTPFSLRKTRGSVAGAAKCHFCQREVSRKYNGGRRTGRRT